MTARVVGVLRLLLLSWFLAAAASDAPSPDARAPAPLPPLALLREGDLVFVRKPGIWSDMSVAFSPGDGRYSHVGIVAMQGPAAVVIHAAGDPADPSGQVRIDTVEHFAAGSLETGVFRFREGADHARSWVDVARRSVARGDGFNSDFRLGTAGRYYCTELVWDAYRQGTGIDLVPRKRSLMGRPYIGLDDLTRHPGVVQLWQSTAAPTNPEAARCNHENDDHCRNAGPGGLQRSDARSPPGRT